MLPTRPARASGCFTVGLKSKMGILDPVNMRIETFAPVKHEGPFVRWYREQDGPAGREGVMTPRKVEPLEETVLDFVRKSEEAVLEVGRKWADAVGEFVPVEVPLVRDLKKQVFDLVEDLLKMQREFAQKMLGEARKAVVGNAKPAPKQAPRTAKRVHKAA